MIINIPSLVSAVSGTVAVAAASAPEDMIGLSDWQKLGVVGVLGSICLATLWFGYKQTVAFAQASALTATANSNAIGKQAEAITQQTAQIAELNAHLRKLKCVRDQG